MGKENPKADFYFDDSEKWQKEMRKLRAIALGCGLTEELKWGCPSYTLGKGNIVLIHEFKEYCAYLFFKGALLKDPKGILIQQTRNVQAARQIRFTTLREIAGMETVLKAYIKQAIEVDKAGLKVEMKRTADFGMPAEFKGKLKEIPGLKTAFESLTPGRQRAYLLYFSSAKQSATRKSRIEKNLDRILDGIGLDD